MFLSFSGMQGTVALHDCDELLDPVLRVTRGWPSETVTDGPSETVAISISAISDGYSRVSTWTPVPSTDDDIADALCDLISDLIDAYLAERPDMLALHAAAVDIGGKLVLFPNQHKAGKSLLSVQLAALGGRVFSDDVLPIDPESSNGIALGIAPRLRLPLPENAGAFLREHLSQCGTITNERYAYVDTPTSTRPMLGTQAPIETIINLNRAEGATEPELTPMPTSSAVKMMIERNLGFRGNANGVLDQLCDIVEKCDCYELRYHDPFDAAKHLMAVFGGRGENDAHPTSTPQY